MNNDYAMLSEAYKRMQNKGKISKTEADKSIRIYDFLANCDIDDIYRLFDSAAFNDIVKNYVQIALNKANVDSKTQDNVLNQIRWLFDEKQAKEVSEMLNNKAD